MAESEGYLKVFKPYLQAKLQESFPDPSQFKKDEEFIYAARVASVFKKVCAELISWVDAKVEEAKYLEKKDKGQITSSFEIGADHGDSQNIE